MNLEEAYFPEVDLFLSLEEGCYSLEGDRYINGDLLYFFPKISCN